MNAMDAIPYEEDSFYIFDRGYNDFKPMKWTRRFPLGSGILSEAIGYMNGELTRGKYPEKIRRIVYWDDERKRKFIFFKLYHNRWQIEFFFKWLKQHLRIKKSWGESENAVRIQIYCAITAYCMMAIVQKKMGIDRPIYETLQLASASLAENKPLDRLFGKPNYNIVNEQDGPTEPTLF
ncbi:MAG: transposase [Bacteroidales bacterium]|nr:transposase [Bacteroidales bacterium]